jgi:R3H domain
LCCYLAHRPKASTAPRETDAADDLEEEVGREVDSSYYSISEAQLAFVNAEIEKVKRAGLQTYDSFTIYPSNALTGSSAGTLQHIWLQPLHIWAPQKFFVNEGLPSQPPCPVHGFTAVVQGKVVGNGWSKPRRVSGISSDQWLVGTKHKCMLCFDTKRELQQQHDLYHGDAAEKAAKLRRARSFHYTFNVYDPRVTRLYAERYTWVAVQMPAVLCSNRTAMTVELARLVKRSCVAGSNPTELMNLLSELRAVHFDTLRLQYYSYHVWDCSAERRGGSTLDSDGVQRKQLSMQQAFARAQPTAASAGAGAAECSKLPMLTAEALGLSQLSHHLLRKFVLCVHAADADYQMVWRQQRVAGDVVQADHTLKVSKGNSVLGVKLLTNKLTFWSAPLNCPLLSLNVDSTSFDDGAVKVACAALMRVYADGRQPVTLAYIDNPHRDEKRLIRRIPSLQPNNTAAQPTDTALQQHDSTQTSSTDTTETLIADVNDAATTVAAGLDNNCDDTDIQLIKASSLHEQHDELLTSDYELSDVSDDVADEIAEEPQAQHSSDSDTASHEDCASVALTMLQLPQQFISAYAESGDTYATVLPAQLSSDDRAALHEYAHSFGLQHTSIGEGCERQLVVQRISVKSSSSAEQGGAGGYDPLWASRRVKYDIRHW